MAWTRRCIDIDDRPADRARRQRHRGRLPDELRRSTPATPGSPWRSGPTSPPRSASPDRKGRYGYFLVPFVKGGVIGDFTIANDASTSPSPVPSRRTARPGVSVRTTWSRDDNCPRRSAAHPDRRQRPPRHGTDHGVPSGRGLRFDLARHACCRCRRLVPRARTRRTTPTVRSPSRTSGPSPPTRPPPGPPASTSSSGTAAWPTGTAPPGSRVRPRSSLSEPRRDAPRPLPGRGALSMRR